MTQPTGSATFTGTVKVGASADPPEIAEYPNTTRTFQFRDHVYVRTRLGVGAEPAPRIPIAFTTVIDGSTLTAAQPADKVALQNSVTIRGGFLNEASYNLANPGFVWGANDFVWTGTSVGDVAGLNDIQGRLTEVHLRAPGSSVGYVTGLVAESKISSEGAGAAITGWLTSMVARAPKREASTATVANAASLRVGSPAPGVATTQWALCVEGTERSYFGGDIILNGSSGTPKKVDVGYGTFRGMNLLLTSPLDTATTQDAKFLVKANADADVVGWIRGRGGQTGDLLRLGRDSVIRTRVDRDGRLAQRNSNAPADADIVNGEVFMYVDATAGAMRLMLKGKDAGGTVRTGSVALA